MVVEHKPRAAAPRRSQQAKMLNTLTHAVLIACSTLVLLPLLFQLSTSLKEAGDVFLFPPQWIPNPARWQNYVDAVTAIPFFVYLRNTVTITALSILGKVLSVTLVAFA